MKRGTAVSAAVLALLVAGCDSGKSGQAEDDDGPFVPTADSSLTPRQVKAWLVCNTFLDSLSYAYEDSFKTADAEQVVRYQKSFEDAQNKVCLANGLRGGYLEYRWISGALPNERNRALREAHKISLVK